MHDDREIAERGCILRAAVGSTLHGLALEGADDRDEMGVCIEPPEYVIGLKRFEHWVYRTKPEGVRGGSGDLDVTIYSLRKFCRLALAGNPTVLLLLFVPREFQTVSTALGARLQALAPAFVSRQAARAFLGYAAAQRQRLVGERGQKRVRRPELVDEHGYDIKYAMHMLRLGFQGRELLETGRLTLPMEDRSRHYLMAVRRGQVPLQEVLARAATLEEALCNLQETSPLALEPDRRAVDVFLIESYEEAWSGMPDCRGSTNEREAG